MSKKIVAALLSVMVICSNFGISVKAETVAEEQTLTHWTGDGLKRYSDTADVPKVLETEISLVAARNEYETGQVVLRSDKQDFTIEGIEFTPLTNGTNVIAAEHLSYNFALYTVETPTDTVGKTGFGPDGGPLMPKLTLPDALSNDLTMTVKRGKNQPIYIKSYIPEGTEAGTYNGTATVRTSLGDKQVPIEIRVFDTAVPSIKDAGFTYYNWMTDIAQGYWTEWNAFDTYYKVEDVLPDATDFTKDFYTITNNWAKSMIEHRQNAVGIHTVALLDAANSTVDDEGNYNFDWTLFDKYVDVWLSNGMTRVANIHFGYHDKDVMLEKDADGNASFIWKNYSVANNYDEKLDRWYTQYLPALAKHIQEYDITKYPQFAGTGNETLFDIWCQQLYDEPTNVRLWTYYAKLTDKYLVNNEGKKVKILDADMTGATRFKPYTDYMDIQVPQISFIPGNEAAYHAEQAKGNEFWSYVCLAPAKPWLNRFVHQPDTTYPMLFWYQAKVNSTGYLHWAWNVWNAGWFYDGDSYMVYPDVENKDVLSTIRYEGQRDGVEDWELLQLAEQTDAEKTKEILDKAIVHPNGVYVEKIDQYRELRLAILELASGNQNVVIPDIDIEADLGAPDAPIGAYYVDNLNSDIKYNGMNVYRHSSERESYRKSVHYQNYTGALGTEGGYAELDFTGTGIEIMSEKRNNKGDIKVELYRVLEDGSTELVENVKVSSCLDGSVEPFFIPYKKTNLEYGDYRIRMTNIRTNNELGSTQMVLDAFIVHTLKEDGTSDVAKITTIKGTNGRLNISSNGEAIISGDKVAKGKDVTITAIPEEGYYCKYININGAPVVIENNSYTVKAIDKDIIIGATFEKISEEIPDPENVALGRAVTASSVATQYGYKIEDLVDGVTVVQPSSKGWSDNNEHKLKDSWVTVELSKPTKIDQVNVYWSAMDIYSPTKYEVQVSDTGEVDDFTTVYAHSGKETNKVSHIFKPVTTKFVRIWIPQDTAATHDAVLMHELEVMSRAENDKGLLQDLITQVEALDKTMYTEESVAILESALQVALICNGNQYATVKEIQTAYDTLKEAKENLVVKATSISVYISGDETGAVGGTSEINMGIQFTDKDIYAQEFWIRYNPLIFRFDTHKLLNGMEYVGIDTNTDGTVRLITFTPNKLISNQDVLNLKFDIVTDKTTSSAIQIGGNVGIIEMINGEAISKTEALIGAEHNISIKENVDPDLVFGDVNGDKQVDVADLALVAYYYRKTSDDPQWETIKKVDVNKDNVIDMDDLVLVANEVQNK